MDVLQAAGGEEHHDALLDSLDAVIIVENEAESIPVHDDENKSMIGGRGVSSSSGLNLLDHCPVCRLNFHSREPKLLPCLHSFCKKCLPSPSRNLAMADPPPTNSHHHQLDGSITKPLNVIRCPVCRQECMEVDVMENFFVKDTVETPSSTVERTVQLCMTCDDNTEATGFCAECMEYMCGTCVDAHQRVKFTKDHTIRHKEEVLQEAHGASTKRPVFCDLHKQEPLKLFCETCDLLTCRDCQLVKHKDHNYQFLEDAYNNHKQHMESMTRQLQEKKRVIEEVSTSINNGLNQVDENRTSVHNEIKKAICSLILEINKKGKILVNQLEAATKDHEGVLRKQQQDIGYLSRHMDHVISFTQWATARNGSTALLYCKRLILFQIGNLLRAKCSASFVPQSSVRFQCRSSYWASNIDLGSLVVETVPGHQLGAFQGIPHLLSHPGGPGPSGSPIGGLGPPGPLHQHLGSHNTLAQLQMQVDKLNPQPHWQPPQPPAPSWTWPWSVRLPRSGPPGAGGPVQGGSPSQSPGGVAPLATQPGGRRFMVPPPNHVSPTGRLPSPGFTSQSVQPLRGVGSSPSHQRGLGSSPSHHPKPVDIFSTSHLYATQNASLPSNGGVSSPHSRESRQLASALIQDFSNFVMSRTPKIDMYFGHGPPPSERTLGSPEEKMEASYLNKRSDPGGTVQMLRPSYPQGLASSIPHRNAQAQQSSPLYPAVSQEEKPGTVHWKPPDPQQQQQQHSGSVASSSAAKRRRRSSPGPVIVIKDEPEDDVSYVQTNQRANLPDSTGDRPQTSSQPGGKRVPTPLQSTENKSPHTPPQQPKIPVLTQGERSEAHTPNRTSGMLGRETGGDGGRGGGPAEDTNEDVCAVCMSGGQLLCCGHCPNVFHLTCHVPSLSTCPSGEWLCSLCRDVAVPEMEYDCGTPPEARAVKEEPDCERGLPPLDKRKCERLLLRLFCSERSSDFHQPALPSVLNESGHSVTTPPPMDVSIVKNRLEAKLSPCYQRPAHFISDMRLLFRNCALLHEADSKVAAAGRELEQQFEDELKVLYPEQTFSQVKMETGNVPASPPAPAAARGHHADPRTPAPNAGPQTPAPNADLYTPLTPAPNADLYTPAPNTDCQTPLPNAGTHTPAPNASPQTLTAPNAEAQTPAAPNTPQGEEQGDAAASMTSHTQQHCL